MYVQVVYLPQNEPKTKGMPFGNQGDLVLSFSKKVPTPSNGSGKNRNEPVEMDFVALHKGTNEIDVAQWEAAINHPFTATEIKRLMSKNCIFVYKPDEGKIGRDTTDFASFEDVEQIVSYCNDVEWLTLSMQVDRRSHERDGGDVRRLIQERLIEIEERKNIVRGGSVGMAM